MQNQRSTTELHPDVNQRTNTTGQENSHQYHPLQDQPRTQISVPQEATSEPAALPSTSRRVLSVQWYVAAYPKHNR